MTAPQGGVSDARILFGVRFPPPDRICDFSVVVFWRRDLLDSTHKFDPTVLDIARSCGTRVILRLHGFSRNVLGESGGVDLRKFEDRINEFAGLIDPYVEDGTILAHITLDEPHACKDWGGTCPTPADVDEAGRISKTYWPQLLTATNTLPSYALQYEWQYTDIINFQYAFHKGDLDRYINGAVRVVEHGLVADIGWSIQARKGGDQQYGNAPMTPEQVEQVARAMCATGRGRWLTISNWEPELMTESMLASLRQVRAACENRELSGGDP